MDNPELHLNEMGRGAFLLQENGEKLGEMVVAVNENTLIVYHTEVDPKVEGKGLAKVLLDAMVDYARTRHLKVMALCPYVHAQFKRHPQDFEDVWRKTEEDN